MHDFPMPWVLEFLLQWASAIDSDELLPLRVPAATMDFLHRLGKQCDNWKKPLARFLTPGQRSQFVDEIVRILLPAEFATLRNELQRIQLEKEEAVANEQFDHARTLRVQQDLLKLRLRNLCSDDLDVNPADFVLAIRNMGFDQAIDVE